MIIIYFNPQIRYRLSPRQTDDNANSFTVDTATGQVRNAVSLTELQGKSIRLVIEAVDRGAKPLKAQAVVNIQVIKKKKTTKTLKIYISLQLFQLGILKFNLMSNFFQFHFDSNFNFI